MEKNQIIEALEQGIKKYKSSPQEAGKPATDNVLKALDIPILDGLACSTSTPRVTPKSSTGVSRKKVLST